MNDRMMVLIELLDPGVGVERGQRTGDPDGNARRAAAWRNTARVVAAYRDRYRNTDETPLGAVSASETQRLGAARAHAALDRAFSLGLGPVNRFQQTAGRPVSPSL